jgi:hypothetical protein
MAQVASCRHLNGETWVCARVNPCGICGGQSGIGTGFFRVLKFSLSVSFLLRSPTKIMWGMNGSSSET